MAFCVLLVTKDDQAVETLALVLSDFGLRVLCCGYPDALSLAAEQKFEVLFLDFDEPHRGLQVIENISAAPESRALTVAMLSDRATVRSALGAGADLILYKPVTTDAANATLRAVLALLRRERRHASRITVQAPITLQQGSEAPVAAILLDLSANGMDLMAARPLSPSARLSVRFALPDLPLEFKLIGEVAWARPNGESAIRFIDTPENLRVALGHWLSDHTDEVPAEGTEPLIDCRLTDLSVGGCYIETASALPEGTYISLNLRAEAVQRCATGVVRVMHPAYGMGIEFVVGSTEEAQQAEDFVWSLASRPRVQPEVTVSPCAAPEANNFHGSPDDDPDDPLLNLLRNHESFSQEVFLEKLQGQRSADFVPS
jgi:CheY-like chemotaxis protein